MANLIVNNITNITNTIITITCDVALGWMLLKSRTEEALLKTITIITGPVDEDGDEEEDGSDADLHLDPAIEGATEGALEVAMEGALEVALEVVLLLLLTSSRSPYLQT